MPTIRAQAVGTLDVGNGATGRAAWMHTGTNADGQMTIGGYGHYEDDLVKVDGEWLFARRRIYNEGNPAWAAPRGIRPGDCWMNFNQLLN